METTICSRWMAAVLLWVFVVVCSGKTQLQHPSFTNETMFSENDNWEPYILAYRNRIYLASTMYYPECPGYDYCANPSIVYRISTDYGKTYSDLQFLCGEEKCDYADIEGQNDPVIASTFNGTLYFTWMNDWNITVARSDNHASSWYNIHYVSESMGWGDKPWIATDDSGKNVYVLWNSQYPLVSISRNGGATWQDPILLVNNGDLYFYPSGLAVTNEAICGSAVSTPNDTARTPPENFTVGMWVFCSTDNGHHWQNTLVAVSHKTRDCPKWAGCRFPEEYLVPGIALAADTKTGYFYAAYGVAAATGQGARLYLSRSTDHGRTWSPPFPLSRNGRSNQLFPMIAVGHETDGDIRVAWMDDRRQGWWNMWYRQAHWPISKYAPTFLTPEVRLSNYYMRRDSGAEDAIDREVRTPLPSNLTIPYKSAKGFRFPYGDYGQLTVDAHGYAHVAWGEGPSWIGPGNVWYVRQTTRVEIPADSGSDEKEISGANGAVGEAVVAWIVAAVAVGWVVRWL